MGFRSFGLSVVCLLCGAATALAQSSSISPFSAPCSGPREHVSGVVRNVAGGEVPFADVSATCGSQTWKATADENGEYRLTLPSGKYTLEAAARGYSSMPQALWVGSAARQKAPPLVLKAGPASSSRKTAANGMVLAPVAQMTTREPQPAGQHQHTMPDARASATGLPMLAQSQTVVVTARAPLDNYRVRSTGTATGTDTPTLDIPQTIQVIPRQTLVDQGAQSLEDAIRNAPGVYVQQGEGNRDEFYLRGVKTKSDFFVNGLRDDSEYYRPLYNVAHVDVLQGPSAILFGRGGAGGIINLVTKKPEREKIRHVTLNTGSWRQWRGTLDFGDALGQSGAYRFMAMGENSGGFRDHYFLHRYGLNPELRFQFSPDTRLDLDFSWLNDRRLADRGIPSEDGLPADVPIEEFFGSPDQNVAHSRVGAFNARLEHRIADHLRLRGAFLVTENDRMYQNVYPGSAVDDQGSLELDAYHHPSNRLSYLGRAEIVAEPRTGRLRHVLLIGSEFGWQRGHDKETLPVDGSKTLPGTFSVADPTVPAVSFPFLDRDNRVVGKEFGIYAEDQLAISRHWTALAGTRFDRFAVDAHYRKPGVTPDFTRRVDTDWSSRVGLIFKPVVNDSIYGSVTQTFTPQGANIALSQTSPKTANLSPQQAVNYEIGNKFELRNGMFSITAALFQLNLNDVVSNAADGSGRLVNTGKQRNRGFELSAEGALTSNWSIFANYTYLDAAITEATQDANEGALPGLIPRSQSSVWTRYAINPHLGAGAGFLGSTSKYTSYDNDVILPGFGEADLMIYYRIARYRIQLNVNNVTGERYYATASGDDQIMPGTPRNVMVSLSRNF